VKRKPAVLTGKFATPEDVGEALGVPKKRVKELRALALHGHGPNIYDPNCAACHEHGMWSSKTENRHLLDISDPNYKPLKEDRDKPRPKYGYHAVKIKKGVLGEISKIQEEVDELRDAEAQGVKIMIYCELSDIYGALRAYAHKHGLKMRDLHQMSRLTRNAFEQGRRK
jgi:phosphoribosyl-ATP pyrophosphohydrolase